MAGEGRLPTRARRLRMGHEESRRVDGRGEARRLRGGPRSHAPGEDVVKVSPGKTNLWNPKYWSVLSAFDEDEYDDNPAWAINLKGRGLVAGVLTGARILSEKATIDSSPRLDGRTVTIRATVN